MKGYLRAYHERAEGEGKHSFVATTAGVKRDGLSLDISGGQVDNYLRNPVFLWAHDYGGRTLPIGRTERLVVMKSKMKAVVQFDMADPFAVEIERKYREKFLSAVSIGWMDIERSPSGGVAKWDLLDISAVPVPGDPDALMERERAALRSILDGGSPEPPKARPVGPYEDFAACVQAMVGEGYSEEDAEAICGAMEQQTVTESAAPSSASFTTDTIIIDGSDRGAIAPHSTPKADEDTAWNGPREVSRCSEEAAALRHMHAWVDGSLDSDTKRAYKLPHHKASGEVVWRGVAAAMARLLQAGTNIPDSDTAGVYAHLARHYRQFDKTPPDRRDTRGFPASVVAGMFHHGEWALLRSELAADVDAKVDELAEAIEAFRASAVQPAEPTDDPSTAKEGLLALAEALKEHTT